MCHRLQADGDGVSTSFMLDGRIAMLWASGTNLDELERHDIRDHNKRRSLNEHSGQMLNEAFWYLAAPSWHQGLVLHRRSCVCILS